MPAGDAPVAPVGKVEVRAARRAVGRDVDPLERDAAARQRCGDRTRKVEGPAAARVGAEDDRVEYGSDLGPDRKAARLKTRADHGAEPLEARAFLGEALRRAGRDLLARAAPPAVEERALRRFLGDERDGRAVGRGDRRPRVSLFDEKAVRVDGRGRVERPERLCLLRLLDPRLHDDGPVHLVEEQGAITLDSDRVAQAPAILEHRVPLVPYGQPEVERGEGAEAHAPGAGREPEPSTLRERSRVGTPEERRSGRRSGSRHGAQIARRPWVAQAVCALMLLGGCARAPVAPSGAEARARFLDAFAPADTATRGAGMLSVKRGKRGRAGLNTRWASSAESVVVVAYVGPVRTLDATVLGDSVYVAIRPYDLGLAGPIPSDEGLAARGLRFLVRPWDFSAPWIRDALERADVQPAEEGWRVAGTLEGPLGAHPFTLELNRKSEPALLRIQRATDERTLVSVRYGPMRRFESGRVPRWIEWVHGEARVRLEIEEHARVKPSQLRRLPPAREEWTILALDDPRGRDLLRRLLGIGEEEVSR